MISPDLIQTLDALSDEDLRMAIAHAAGIHADRDCDGGGADSRCPAAHRRPAHRKAQRASGMNNRWTSDFWMEPRVALLKRLVAEGYTYSAIAKKIGGGCTRNMALSKSRRLHLEQPKKPAAPKAPTGKLAPLPPEALSETGPTAERAKKLYLEYGISLRQIGLRIGMSHEGVRGLLQRAGVEVRPRGIRQPTPKIQAPAPDAHVVWVPAPERPERRGVTRAPKLNRPPLAELAIEPPPRLRGRSVAVPSAPRQSPPQQAISRSLPAEPRPREASIIRLKPVTPNIVRWSRAYLARGGVTVDYLAGLFDVPPDALARALRPEAQAA